MKRKLIELSETGYATTPQRLNSVMFAFYGLKKKSRRKRRQTMQLTRWDLCRETMAHFVRECMIQDSPYKTVHEVKGLLDTNIKVLLLYANNGMALKNMLKRTKEMTKRGVKIVNLFETELGWPLSVPFVVSSKISPPSTVVYAIEGSKKWMQSPHLISLYLLLLRGAGRFETFDDVKTCKSFYKKCIELGNRYLTDTYSRKSKPQHSLKKWPEGRWAADLHNLYDSANRMLFFLKNVDELYKDRKVEDLFTHSNFSDGFRRLCNHKADDSTTNNRFKEMCEKDSVEDEKSLYTIEAELREEREKQNKIATLKRNKSVKAVGI